MNEKHCYDLLGGQALDALDAEDRALALAHLEHCPQCRDGCAELRNTLHRCFGTTLPQRAPSTLVRTQFLARLAVELCPPEPANMPARPMTPPLPPMITLTEQPPRPAGGVPSVPSRPASSRYAWMIGGAAVPAMLMLVLGVLFIQTRGQLDSTRSQQAASFPLTGAHSVLPLSGLGTRMGAAGEVIVPANGTKGMMLVTGLHTPPAGMSYRCWVRRANQWVGCGRLAPDSSGIAMVLVDHLVNGSTSQAIAVNMEHSPRPSAPTAPMLLSTTL